jgi:hypothetical protein
MTLDIRLAGDPVQDPRGFAATLIQGQQDLSRAETSNPIWHWSPMVIPGPLQTRRYAQTTISALPDPVRPEEAEQLIADRMARGEALASCTNQRRFVLTDWLLERPFADLQAVQEQRRHIAALNDLDHIHVRVVLSNFHTHLFHPVQVIGDQAWVEGPRGMVSMPGGAQAYLPLFNRLWQTAIDYPAWSS